MTESKETVVIKFAGDSGDGMQLTGTQFTNKAALIGNDIATFPDFPAEIRAPQGTLPGVSGFQLHFGCTKVYTPGDACDILIAMNAAALIANIKSLKPGATIIADLSGFDSKNLRLANIPEEQNPLLNDSLQSYRLIKADITKLTRESLKESNLGIKEIDRCKNMFVLGFVYWMYNRSLDFSEKFLNQKFSKKPEILEANIKVLRAGYAYGETTETAYTRYQIHAANLSAGTYRSVMGNEATVLGLLAASQKSKLPLFLGSYPITPASDILHELAKYKSLGVRTFQAEDEIAAICSAIGASFGGALGITASSGPGISLKQEALGLAVMLEIPLVICNIQRGGPSTGLPTKTEQSDLLQVMYGRNGECPMPIIASCTPSDCFESVYEAVRIAVEHMTPVMFLSDGYIANGAEPWQFPTIDQLQNINTKFAEPKTDGEKFMPYSRDEKLSRPWAIPGTAGLEHRIGGLEKQNITGNISYDPENHEEMVLLREEKIERISNYIPLQSLDSGNEKGKMLIMGWGSTYGSIKAAAIQLRAEGYDIAHAHIRYIKPFPRNLGDMIKNYEKILVPEINNGQLIKILRDKYMIDCIPFNKIKGMPITKAEIIEKVKKIY